MMNLHVFITGTVLLPTLLVCVVTRAEGSVDLHGVSDGKIGIKFLVTVNDTWDENGCIATVASPMLMAGVKYNNTKGFTVGKCDHGPLQFDVQKLQGKLALMQVDLTFYSSEILDAAPPQCSILWNGTYKTPTSQNPRESLLPGCFVMDSREGDHMTYFWFHIYEWQFY